MRLLTQNYKEELSSNLSVLENLNQKRKRHYLRNKRLYYAQSTFNFLKTVSLIALGFWCYSSRFAIREYIIEVFNRLN